MKPRIVTIGVYGFKEEQFFQALLDAKVDTFCDIRRRRGMRDHEYAFANSTRLQQKLRELGIKYVHVKGLAPDQAIRDKQKQEDEQSGMAKRSRSTLGQTFINAYEHECLAHFNSSEFIDDLGKDSRIISLFCVEREPGACHRSLAAKKLAKDLELQVEHLKP
jgi:uncharacterized protein (DUF488 family)